MKLKDIAEAVREPTRNTRIHDKLIDHGFEYKGTRNGTRHYIHKSGSSYGEATHKFPTPNGNHSFSIRGSGKVNWKSTGTSDTEIQQHLEKHYPKKVNESMKIPSFKEFLKEQEEAPKKDQYHIHGTRWRDKTYGNTYHKVHIYKNGQHIHSSDMHYGYGDHYLETAREHLKQHHPELGVKHDNGSPAEPMWRWLREKGNGHHTVADVSRKKDL